MKFVGILCSFSHLLLPLNPSQFVFTSITFKTVLVKNFTASKTDKVNGRICFLTGLLPTLSFKIRIYALLKK